MPLPNLTADEIAQLQKEKAKAESAAQTYAASVAALQARADELSVVDGAFKKFFDYYNDSIIGKYDAERKALNGQYIQNPVTEADIVDCANLSGRLLPALPATDIVRIAEFDGGPLVVDPLNETQHISDQSEVENALVNGYPGFIESVTLSTTTTVNSSSTTLDVSDSTNPLNINVNDVFVLSDSGDIAVVKVTSITPGGGGPPYTASLGIELIIAPSGTLSSGLSPIAFSGFTNGERSSKTASNSNLQPLMNNLISQLEDRITDRISRLDEQLAAISANEDPDGTAQFIDATTNINTSKMFLENYLLTTDISDTGIGNLSTERGVRSSQITSRVAEIVANYTGQTENYFDKRYSIANDRANTSRGSLRIQKAALSTASQSQAFADTLTAQAKAIGDILP